MKWLQHTTDGCSRRRYSLHHVGNYLESKYAPSPYRFLVLFWSLVWVSVSIMELQSWCFQERFQCILANSSWLFIFLYQSGQPPWFKVIMKIKIHIASGMNEDSRILFLKVILISITTNYIGDRSYSTFCFYFNSKRRMKTRFKHKVNRRNSSLWHLESSFNYWMAFKTEVRLYNLLNI